MLILPVQNRSQRFDKRSPLSVRCHGDYGHMIILPVWDTSLQTAQQVCGRKQRPKMFSCLKSCICCEERITNSTTNSETGNTERGRNTGNTEMVGNTELSDDVIERLAVSIVATNMETIAISYMKIQSETLDNLKITHRGNTTAFNRAVLTIWKCMNPRDNQVQVSSSY